MWKAGAKDAAVTRTRAETELEGTLTFDGFLSFHCKTRADSSGVVSQSVPSSVDDLPPLHPTCLGRGKGDQRAFIGYWITT